MAGQEEAMVLAARVVDQAGSPMETSEKLARVEPGSRRRAQVRCCTSKIERVISSSSGSLVMLAAQGGAGSTPARRVHHQNSRLVTLQSKSYRIVEAGPNFLGSFAFVGGPAILTVAFM